MLQSLEGFTRAGGSTSKLIVWLLQESAVPLLWASPRFAYDVAVGFLQSE